MLTVAEIKKKQEQNRKQNHTYSEQKPSSVEAAMLDVPRFRDARK